MRDGLQLIDMNHPLYAEETELRFRVLREPLGMPRSAVQFPFEPQCLHLVALQSGRVVGCVLFHPDGEAQGRLLQMAVTPALQGTGVGRQLVLELERVVAERGFKRVHLHAREQATGFYARLGYAVYGEPFVEVSVPHRLMEKAL